MHDPAVRGDYRSRERARRYSTVSSRRSGACTTARPACRRVRAADGRDGARRHESPPILDPTRPGTGHGWARGLSTRVSGVSSLPGSVANRLTRRLGLSRADRGAGRQPRACPGHRAPTLQRLSAPDQLRPQPRRLGSAEEGVTDERSDPLATRSSPGGAWRTSQDGCTSIARSAPSTSPCNCSPTIRPPSRGWLGRARRCARARARRYRLKPLGTRTSVRAPVAPCRADAGQRGPRRGGRIRHIGGSGTPVGLHRGSDGGGPDGPAALVGPSRLADTR